MARTLVDNKSHLFVEPSRVPGTRNPYAELPCVAKIAAIAVSDRRILDVLAGFVVTGGRRFGYGKKETVGLRARTLALHLPQERAGAAVTALLALSETFTGFLNGGDLDSDRRNRLATDFTGAISEAIVFQLLIRSGRARETIVRDASFFDGQAPIASRRNVDFFCSLPPSKWAELYECETDLKWLLGRYASRDAIGNKRDWEKSQLFLMLRVQEILTGLSWDVQLGCVTLHGQAAVNQDLRIMKCPSQLAIHPREALGTTFPPPLPG